MHFDSAIHLRQLLAEQKISARELMQATYAQINRLNPRLNALVNVIPKEDALRLADAADKRIARGDAGPLEGLPMAPKDAEDVSGLPTTYGFVPWRNRVAKDDSLMVRRLRNAGALCIGKSNMPEFGLGSHTFNNLFGPTFNPWDTTRTPGGSSGGAAVALATGMLPIADGSDMGGSLRNPASFCNVVGFRPSLGRVPDDSRAYGWFSRLDTRGPMGRTVDDVALLLSVQAGPVDVDPLALTESGETFRLIAERDLKGLRVGWSPDLGLPVDPAVKAVMNEVPPVLRALGCEIDTHVPDFSGAMDVFNTQRGAQLASLGRSLDVAVPDWRQHAKDTAVWNIDFGLALTGEALLRAEIERTRIYRRIAAYFETVDALFIPAAQVPPFNASLAWVHEIDGVKLPTYLDWMQVCCVISITGLPAISVPAGCTEEGLPVGVQIVGKPRGDKALLEIARAFESATNLHRRRPPLC
ncbi:MAG: amidase [Gammaproteobacteria bacterium]|nr:amidase [Gammaproteobacteria bacterium]